MDSTGQWISLSLFAIGPATKSLARRHRDAPWLVGRYGLLKWPGPTGLCVCVCVVQLIRPYGSPFQGFLGSENSKVVLTRVAIFRLVKRHLHLVATNINGSLFWRKRQSPLARKKSLGSEAGIPPVLEIVTGAPI